MVAILVMVVIAVPVAILTVRGCYSSILIMSASVVMVVTAVPVVVLIVVAILGTFASVVMAVIACLVAILTVVALLGCLVEIAATASSPPPHHQINTPHTSSHISNMPYHTS